MKTKCILFDADGVIIKADVFSIQYQKQFGVSNDKMLPFFKGVFQDCLVGKADLKEVVHPYLDDWKWTGTVDDFLEFWFKAEHHIDERMLKLIKVLQGKNIKCYLVTKQEKHRTEYIRNEMGLEDVFDHIFSSADIGSKKPEREFYESIFQWIEKTDGFKKDELFFVDDSRENVDAAREFGIDSMLYQNFDDFEKKVTTLVK
jgi:putative hydrolase of the HAD superfamily